MSAHIVTERCINAIVSYCRTEQFYQAMFQVKDDEQLGQKLMDLNYRAVSGRYNEISPIPTYCYSPCFLNRIAVYKYVSGLIYQCSEPINDDDNTLLSLRHLKAALADRIISGQPEYETASWT